MTLIRTGQLKDITAVYELIKELADYENAIDEVETTPESMEKDAFFDNSLFRFIVAEQNSKIVGTAIYFFTYSTWKGKVLYLEDIVVSQSHRRGGIGKLLFDFLVKTAKEEHVKRMSWQVLNWNEPAINFYKKISTTFDDTWINCKLTQSQIDLYSCE
jgi:GNAT superfamily N-acetyltransferase